ncbi:MAG: DUF1963 domain-containing protein [Ruminococcus sp.]|nr:DUF1963 domain-containing protein [Ruminococcus sp.]
MPDLTGMLKYKGLEYRKMADELKNYYRNAVILLCREKQNIPTGASKMGGFPDLPPEIEYPTMSECTIEQEHYEKSAMQLVAQINLYELAESGADVENLLPKTGMLYILWSGEVFELESNKYIEIKVTEPDKTAFHKVIYWDGDMSTLKRTEPPCPYYSKYFEECFEEYSVTFDSDSEYSEDSASEIDGLEEAVETDSFEFTNSGDKILGFPKGANVPYLDENTVSLFQFDYHMGCLWSEYWLIKKEDLKNCDFSKVLFSCDMD